MNRQWLMREVLMIGTAAAGAGLMFLVDPASGARRRKLIGERVTSLARLPRYAGRAARHLKRGVAHEANAPSHDDAVADSVLVQRVRSQMGHVVSHPSSIEVTADQGRIAVSGPILAGEVDRLMHKIASIPGVVSIQNRLSTTGRQEPAAASGRRFDRLRRRLGLFATPAGRYTAVGTLSAVALAYGVSRLMHRSVDGTDAAYAIAGEVGL